MHYILPHEFKNSVEKVGFEGSNFSLMHFNARSLVNKIDAVTNLINDLAFDFTAIAVTETWANLDNESGLNIQGYNYFGRPRAGRRGGGVAIYI